MATGLINAALYVTGPGILYTAPLLTAEPAHTVLANAFPVTPWPAAWAAVGSTADGWTFKDDISTANVAAAESYYPVKVITTGRAAGMDLVLQEISASNLKRGLNTSAATVTGATTTTLTQLQAPAVGAEVRSMWGWQSEDNTVRFIAYQALQTAGMGMKFTKGATPAQLTFALSLELGATGAPYSIYLAGAVRGA